MLSFRNAALALSLIAHLVLVWYMAHTVFGEPMPPKPPLAIELIRLPPPPPPPPPPKVEKKVVKVKPTRAPMKLAPRVGPPIHYFSANGDTLATPGVDHGGVTTGPGGSGGHTPSEYEDKVKARIVAAKVYPQMALLQKRQCAVQYTVTVDKQGNMVSYRIDPCPDEELNTAARNAVINGGPYPPPPGYSGDTYEISGTLIFRIR
jgi:periplasmic protein TonB